MGHAAIAAAIAVLLRRGLRCGRGHLRPPTMTMPMVCRRRRCCGRLRRRAVAATATMLVPAALLRSRLRPVAMVWMIGLGPSRREQRGRGQKRQSGCGNQQSAHRIPS
jgi:hypothetical protein